MGLKKNSPGCGCCSSCCSGWTLVGTVTFGNRKGNQDPQCYDTEAEVDCSDCYAPLADRVISLSEGLRPCTLYNGFDDALLERDTSQSCRGAGETFDPECPWVSSCASSPPIVGLSYADWPQSNIYSYSGTSVEVDYSTDEILVYVVEYIWGVSSQSWSVFRLLYESPTSLCNTSVSLTLADFTATIVDQEVGSDVAAPTELRDATKAITFDLVAS